MSFVEIIESFRSLDVASQRRLLTLLTAEMRSPLVGDDPLTSEEEVHLAALADAARQEAGSVPFTATEAEIEAARLSLT